MELQERATRLVLEYAGIDEELKRWARCINGGKLTQGEMEIALAEVQKVREKQRKLTALVKVLIERLTDDFRNRLKHTSEN